VLATTGDEYRRRVELIEAEHPARQEKTRVKRAPIYIQNGSFGA
jgi:hypothetical protein